MKAVILNDTSASGHLGCSRVMRVMRDKLYRADIRVSAVSPVRHDWENDRRFLGALAQADLVLINGEGTLHDGRRHGARLLRVVDHPARRAAPVVLINTVYQANPDAWRDWLSRMALIVARDSRSARELSALLGRRIEHLPDLSLCDGFADVPGHRQGILLGDSVRLHRRRLLARAVSGLENAAHLSIKSPPWLRRLPSGAAPLGAWLAFNICNGVLAWRQPARIRPRNEGELLSRLAGAAMHVTGRFHGVALSLVTRTPFLALGSNTWKIESLLDDVGISKDRLVRPGGLSDRLARGAVPHFTPGENRALERFMAQARSQSDSVFQRIRALPGPA
jgi:hypothetical protein